MGQTVDHGGGDYLTRIMSMSTSHRIKVRQAQGFTVFAIAMELDLAASLRGDD